MALDSRQQQFNSMGYDTLRYPSGPHFTNPWASAAPAPGQMYATSLPQNNEQRYAAVSAPYTSAQIAAPALATGIAHMASHLFNQNGLPVTQDGLSAARTYTSQFTSHPTTTSYAPTSAPAYTAPYSAYPADRRPSHPFNTTSEVERQNFNDAMDASRGMLAMSQSDITPRNIYGNPQPSRSSGEYGFPGAHSSHSSISSASYPTYYNSSASEASVGDYSSASESVDMPSSRTLPKPLGLHGNLPPAPQSMMGQFSSKVSSSSQKKHKCKICDKRFTRPSSLQTHMYSHTGEKPFACDVEGCGRHFSVVSNLRRHRKVHKGEGHDDHPSPEDDDE